LPVNWLDLCGPLLNRFRSQRKSKGPIATAPITQQVSNVHRKRHSPGLVEPSAAL
jgi:hypothetical protein